MDIANLFDSSLLLFFVVYALREQNRVLDKVMAMIEEKNERQEKRQEKLYALLLKCMSGDNT